MADKFPRALVIRSGLVWRQDTGYILACDPKKEEEDPHVEIFLWQRGAFSRTWAKFNAHSLCRVSHPGRGFVYLSSEGLYGVNSQTSHAGNVFTDSAPPAPKARYGNFRSVADVAGRAYAVGLRGMVYRLDEWTRWTRIDDGLPETFDIQAIDGFDASDLYAVGFRGEGWRRDGRTWSMIEMPTNVNLTAVLCAPDGVVYVAGHNGVLIAGREDRWSVIEHDETDKHFWDLAWFADTVYASTMSGVYALEGGRLSAIDFGPDAPGTTYRLSAASDALWSIGEKDVMAFDGSSWSRVL